MKLEWNVLEKAGKVIQDRIDKYENEIKVIQKSVDANGKLTDVLDKSAKISNANYWQFSR